MDRSNPRTRIVFSIVGIVFITVSLVLNFVLAGSAWAWVSWLLLGAALLMVLLSRRYR